MKKTVIKPIGENVLISPEKAEQKTSSGIYLPDGTTEGRQQIGTIIEMGFHTILVKKGDKVIFRRFVGEEIKLDGEEYLVTNFKDILAVIK